MAGENFNEVGDLRSIRESLSTLAAAAPATAGATAAKQDDLNRGATSTSRILSAAGSTNATSAKAGAGILRKIIGYNARASAVYLKVYDKATAPTVGTDIPVLTFYLPATGAFALDVNQYFATGIAYALTTGVADADTGAVTAADILGLNVTYS